MARIVHPDRPADDAGAAWFEELRRRNRPDLEPAWTAVHGSWIGESRRLRAAGLWRQYDERLRERAAVGLPGHDVLREGSPPPGGWSADMLTVPSRAEAARLLAEAREGLAEAREGRPTPVRPAPPDVVPMRERREAREDS